MAIYPRPGAEVIQLDTYFLGPSSGSNASTNWIRVGGAFEAVEDAVLLGIAVAENNPQFRDWCEAFEIEDPKGAVIHRWDRQPS